jgi:hypothetical protein
LLDAIAHLLQLELHDDGHYSYKGGVDREAKLNEWERFYNFHRQTHAFANLIVPYLSPRTNIKKARCSYLSAKPLKRLVAGARLNQYPQAEMPCFSVFRFIPRTSPNYHGPKSERTK